MKTYDELKSLIDERGVHEVFGAYGQGQGIEQNSEELAQFLVICQDLGVTSCLEIGTGYKAGLARFLHDDLGWEVVSVDVQNYGHQYAGIQFVTGLGSVQGRFDLVLIDAEHTYEAVKHDHEVWAFHATKVIAFHDIAGLRDCEGVERYWYDISVDQSMEVDRKPGYHEIIADTPERGGIGYIVLAEVEAPAPEQLITPETIAKLKAKLLADEPPAKPKPTPRKRTPAKPKAPAKK